MMPRTHYTGTRTMLSAIRILAWVSLVISVLGLLFSIGSPYIVTWFFSIVSSFCIVGFIGVSLAIIDMADISRDDYNKQSITEDLEERFADEPSSSTPLSPAHMFKPTYYYKDEAPKQTKVKRAQVIQEAADMPPRKPLTPAEEAQILKQVEAEDRARFNKSGDEKPQHP